MALKERIAMTGGDYRPNSQPRPYHTEEIHSLNPASTKLVLQRLSCLLVCSSM